MKLGGTINAGISSEKAGAMCRSITYSDPQMGKSVDIRRALYFSTLNLLTWSLPIFVKRVDTGRLYFF